MNQKIINLVEKTQKKAPLYEAPKSKRFQRKRSQQSDRSIDSKRSRNSANQVPVKINQIPNLQNKNAKIHINTSDFYQNLANSVLFSKQLLPNKPRYSRLRSDRPSQEIQNSKQLKKQTIDYHTQALSAQLQVRNKQLQVIASELKLLKQSLKQQKQKSKKIQEQKKQIYLQLSQKAKQLQKIQLQNKKLLKQKQYLVKQIQFLQKINYDDKTRNAQSYRQKYLSKQIQQLRMQLNSNKSEVQKRLQSQVKKVTEQKYSLQNLNKALTLAKQTIINQYEKVKSRLRSQQKQQKMEIYNSNEYINLRQKYIKILDAYKNLKIQYVDLQKQLNRSLSNIPQHILNSNSELSVVLSSSDSQDSLKKNHKLPNKCPNKQNRNQFKVQKNKNIMFIQVQNQTTPIKKSLSPRNTDQKTPKTQKKSNSPKNSKKYVQNGIKPSPQTNSTILKNQKKYQKTSTFFNEAYRLKIGLGKLSVSDKKQ